MSSRARKKKTEMDESSLGVVLSRGSLAAAERSEGSPGEPQRSAAAAKAGADSVWQRQDVLDVAYQLHPERFVRSAPKPPALPSEVWINKPASTPETLPVGEGR
jgi:hypothetical protein